MEQHKKFENIHQKLVSLLTLKPQIARKSELPQIWRVETQSICEWKLKISWKVSTIENELRITHNLGTYLAEYRLVWNGYKILYHQKPSRAAEHQNVNFEGIARLRTWDLSSLETLFPNFQLRLDKIYPTKSIKTRYCLQRSN